MLAAVSAVITLAAVVSFLFVQTAAAERAARNQARMTGAVLAELREALVDGVNAETGHRGYLLTGDERYLDPYQTGVRNWTQRIDRVNALIGSSITVTQMENVKQLRALAEAKLEAMRGTLAMAQAGDQAGAVAVLRNDFGRRLMDEYRRVSDAIEAEEAAILEATLNRAERIDGRNEPLLMALMALMLLLIGILFWLERAAVKGALAAQEAASLRLARDHAELMSRELNHRVKNLFSVILSMIGLAGRGHTDISMALKSLRDRVYALSVAHTVTQGGIGSSVASMDTLLRSTLAPYNPSGGRIGIDGENVVIDAKSVTPLGLVLHELATNAVKYGALSTESGKLHIKWGLEEGAEGARIRLIWAETGVPGTVEPASEGFGSTMISASASQLGGDLMRKWESDGLTVELVFPISEEPHGEMNDET